jgi:hypothetical protein
VQDSREAFTGDCSGLALVGSPDSDVLVAVAFEVAVLRMDRFFNPSHISSSNHLET